MDFKLNCCFCGAEVRSKTLAKRYCDNCSTIAKSYACYKKKNGHTSIESFCRHTIKSNHVNKEAAENILQKRGYHGL